MCPSHFRRRGKIRVEGGPRGVSCQFFLVFQTVDLSQGKEDGDDEGAVDDSQKTEKQYLLTVAKEEFP